MIIPRVFLVARSVSWTGHYKIFSRSFEGRGLSSYITADLFGKLSCIMPARSSIPNLEAAQSSSHASMAFWQHQLKSMSSSSAGGDGARAAALQRLSRASRHRSHKSSHAPSSSRSPGTPSLVSDPTSGSPEPAPGSSSSTSMVVVTPSETKASDVQLSEVVGHQALVITRPVEWGTVIFGYEQANKVCPRGRVVCIRYLVQVNARVHFSDSRYPLSTGFLFGILNTIYFIAMKISEECPCMYACAGIL